MVQRLPVPDPVGIEIGIAILTYIFEKAVQRFLLIHPEFFRLKQDCKFNNCLHVNEPKCAVKNALEKGEIAPSRYKSYLQLLAGEDENYRLNVFE